MRIYRGLVVPVRFPEAKWIEQDPEVVKGLAKRSGQILLALLEEMRANHSVAQSLHEWLAPFIRSVLDGTCFLPSEMVFNFRLYDEHGAFDPYPLLEEAVGIFSIAIHLAQPEDWATYVAQLEADFAKREIGAGRVKG